MPTIEQSQTSGCYLHISLKIVAAYDINTYKLETMN